MPKQYHINGRQFATKTQLQECIRELVAHYPNDQPLSQDDFEFMMAVLDRHQERDAKVGCGVAHITVRTNFNHGGRTRGFWITRLDGTETDFSWVKCLSPVTHAQDIRKACRDTISDQLLDFKMAALEAGPVRCPYTDEPLTVGNCHADHIAPDTFLNILEEFLKVRGLTYSQIRVAPTTDGEVYNRLEDPALAADWSAFHKSKAKLRLLSRTGNLSHARRTQ